MAIKKRGVGKVVKEIVPQNIINAIDFNALTKPVIDAYHQAGYHDGLFERSIFRMNGSNTRIVLDAPEYTRYMLYGRRPGKMPPVAPIASWCAKYGISISPWAVAKKIAREGTKGNDFLSKQSVNDKVIEELNRQLKAIINKQI